MNKLRIVYVKRVLKLSIAVLGFCSIIRALNYMYVDTTKSWYRILWHHFYEDKGKIENLYLGSSHVYCGVKPSILDEENEQYNFNLATPLQRLNGSYYLLRESTQYNELSHVYLELYYMCSVKENFNDNIDPICERSEYSRNWQNTDFMNNSFNKAAYLYSIGGVEDFPDILFPFIRYRTKLDDWKYIKRVIKEKREKNYQDYKYRKEYKDNRGYAEYLGQGYFFSNRIYTEEERVFYQSRIIDENPLGEVSERYLRKIISYCQDKKIPITLFVAPMDELQLVSTGDYDNYIKQIRNIAKEYAVDFYDFNLAREEYLPIYKGKYFLDEGHLNDDGANIFTPFFYEIVSGERKDTKQYFYSSYEERLKESEPEVYGLYYRNGGGIEGSSRIFHIASNREEGMEYQIIIAPNEKEQYVLQEFDSNKVFSLPDGESGECAIVAREAGSTENIQIMKIQY